MNEYGVSYATGGGEPGETASPRVDWSIVDAARIVLPPTNLYDSLASRYGKESVSGSSLI